MLPDFPIPVRVGSRRALLIGRDVSVGLFFAGFPNTIPMTDCFVKASRDEQRELLRQLERWALALATRVLFFDTGDRVFAMNEIGARAMAAVVEPITPADVMRLADVGERAMAIYLRMIGFTRPKPENDPLQDLVGVDLPMAVVAKRQPWLTTILPLTEDLEANPKFAIRMVAQKSRLSPGDVLMSPITHFVTNWRVMLQDDMLQRMMDMAEGADGG